MVHLINRQPGVGWIRANELPADDILSETIRLQKRCRELESELKEYQEGSPVGTSLFAQGRDQVKLICRVQFLTSAIPAMLVQDGVSTQLPTGETDARKTVEIETDWDAILDAIARLLLKVPSERDISRAIEVSLRESCARQVQVDVGKVKGVELTLESLETVRIQFRALGIVTQQIEQMEFASSSFVVNSGPRTLSVIHWILTPYGDRLVAQRLAIRRSVQE